MPETAVSHTYRYAFESRAVAAPGGLKLSLATSDGDGANTDFFRGRLTRPARAAELLRSLGQVARARFYLPPAMMARIAALVLDPVVTCGDEVVRFEAFTQCCSAYARVDLLPEALDGERTGRGTTNVDFNAPTLAALARVRDRDVLGLAIGADSVEFSRGAEPVVERKVKLPPRWLKGFVEVQAYQARMARRLEVPGPEAARFLRSLPRGAGRSTAWVVPSGRGLRLSRTAARDGVRLGGVAPLLLLENLARHARSLRICADEPSGASAWELLLDEARFQMVVSPDPSRGFSGEGQALGPLAFGRWADALPRVQASLRWETRIDAAALAAQHGLDRAEIEAALAVLGARGLVGFDLAEGAYFHRELPFDRALVETLHPRLKDARKLAAEGGVRFVRRDRDRAEAYVPGTGAEHRVLIAGDTATCTCRWYAKHQGVRGQCTHVLAVQILLNNVEADRAEMSE